MQQKYEDAKKINSNRGDCKIVKVGCSLFWGLKFKDIMLILQKKKKINEILPKILILKIKTFRLPYLKRTLLF